MEKINFDEEMKKYFYEMATCDDDEFRIIKAVIKRDKNLTPKARKYMDTFFKYVGEARKTIKLRKVGK